MEINKIRRFFVFLAALLFISQITEANVRYYMKKSDNKPATSSQKQNKNEDQDEDKNDGDDNEIDAVKHSKHLWEYKKKHFNLYSVKSDINFGEKYMKMQIKDFKKDHVGVDDEKHAALKARIEKIVNRLAAVSDKPDFPYEVHIFDKPDIVNAFCMPGGKIGVFTGLFDTEKGLVDINSDDQIAAVLGHEMAHATMRHVTRTLTTYQGLNIFGTAASIGLGTGVGAEAEQIFANVFTVGVNLYLPGYSRKYEREADQVGFYYMSKAGYNPQAAIDIWQKAAKRGGSNAKKTDFFASHPANGERAKSLNGWLEDAESVKSGARSENGPPCRHREKRSDVAIQSGLLRYARNDDHKINK